MKSPQAHFAAIARKLLAVLFAVGAISFLASAASAQSVSAELSQPYTSLGQPVQLNIVVTGGRGAQINDHMQFPGLDLSFMGRSEQVNIVNFQVNVSSTYSFLVTPSQNGILVIPPISIRLAGKTYQTQSLTLQVGAGLGSASPPPPSAQPATPPPQSEPTPLPDDKLAFGELIIPKETAYVGEVVPVEARFYFADTYPVRLSQHPSFSGDGFTVMNFSNPVQRQAQVGNQLYNVVCFQTAITAVKTGPLEIAPATLDAQIQMPGQMPSGNMGDIFSAFFGASGMGAETRNLTVSTKASHLDVKPLPAQGRPDDFSGAIGQFSLRASASPKKADPGDPITLAVTVSGRGNFDGMSAPILLNDDAWKSYPPSEAFKASPSDPIGFNGDKDFNFMIVARTDATLTPEPKFSFFDPTLERYVTLKAAPIAVTARGSSAVAPPVAAAASSTPSTAPAPSAAAPAASATPALASDWHPATFQPFVFNRELRLAAGIAAVLWLIVLIIGITRALAGSDYARQNNQRRETRRLLHQLEDTALTPEQFFQIAGKFIRDRLAPWGSNSDTRELVDKSSLTLETREHLRRLLNRGDEWNYSAGSSSFLDHEERHQLTHQLKTFDEELRP